MPIPDRLRFSPASSELVAKLGELCDQIEGALEAGDSAEELLAEWHRHAGRTCEPHEFTRYWKSTSQEQFVRDALNPTPEMVDDLTYAEASAVLESVMSAELEENETHYYLRWLEMQFPNSNMSDLIYWPDEWFGDATLFRDADGEFKPEAELTTDQMLAYAMQKSGRSLPDCPANVRLSFPLPP